MFTQKNQSSKKTHRNLWTIIPMGLICFEPSPSRLPVSRIEPLIHLWSRCLDLMTYVLWFSLRARHLYDTPTSAHYCILGPCFYFYNVRVIRQSSTITNIHIFSYLRGGRRAALWVWFCTRVFKHKVNHKILSHSKSFSLNCAKVVQPNNMASFHGESLTPCVM